jgi:hypothetical protein
LIREVFDADEECMTGLMGFERAAKLPVSYQRDAIAMLLCGRL